MTLEAGTGRRGAPLMFLVAVVGGWAVARVATFTPLSLTMPNAVSSAASPSRPALAASGFSPEVRFVLPDPGSRAGVREDWSRKGVALALPPTGFRVSDDTAIDADVRAPSTRKPEAALAMAPPGAPYPAGVIAVLPPAPRSASRWSADGWLLLRESEAVAGAAARPSYGRSQAGAVLRYGLAPSSAHLPQAYLRATTALAGPREQEIATGLSARLARGVPLRVAAEVRVSETGGRTEVRPAAYAVTELPSFKLPLGTRSEIYLQGGYVGGSFATAFIDGQARIERPLLRSAGAEFSLGGGAWGGAQKGAARMDVGPTAALSFSLGPVRGRVAADYRFPMTGDAAPSSGPALTVSAGF